MTILRYADIAKHAADVFQVSADDVYAKRKGPAAGRARSAAAYVAYTHIPHASFGWIAARLGCADHTAARFHVRRARKLIETDPSYAALVKRVEAQAVHA